MGEALLVGSQNLRDAGTGRAALAFPISAVDLFCGAGGLTRGLEKAGIDVRLGVDVDPACEYPYTANNKARFLLKSVEDLRAEEISKSFPAEGVRVLGGCAPCQTFSTYNQKAGPDDERWWLLEQFSRLVGELLPEIVTMENVPRLMRQSVFKDFVRALEASGYEVSFRPVRCQEYGVPQRRQRLVLLASRLGPITLLPSHEAVAGSLTVRASIATLPPLKAGEKDATDALHQAAGLSSTNLARIKASLPGGTWRDWGSNLRADCHTRRSGKTYPSVYGRMSWDEVAPTITTQFYGFGNGRFGHPDQDRAISLREGAILQSFPPDYEFVRPGDPIYKATIGRLVGNAVPVELGFAIGSSIVAHVGDWASGSRDETNRLPSQ